MRGCEGKIQIFPVPEFTVVLPDLFIIFRNDRRLKCAWICAPECLWTSTEIYMCAVTGGNK